MLHRTDMHYYNIEEIGMRNRYYRTAAIKAAVIYLVGTLRKKEKKRRNLIVFARFLWIFARIYSTINERIRTRILLEEELEMKREDMIWSDRKRNWLGLPWTFTVYGLTEDRLFIKTGVLNIHEDEVRLYRILDLSLRRSFWQRIVGLGTIHVDSSDKTMKAFDIHNIRDCENVKEQLSGLVEQERDNKRVSSREFIGGYEDEDDGFDEPDGHY